MRSDSDQYDFFVSYARRDNLSGWISQLINDLLEEHRKFSGGRELTRFFDQSDIHSLSDWQTEIFNKGLARSRLFLAFLSPAYFASEWCRREWRAWVDLEISKHILTAGAAPIYIVEVPGLISTPPLAEHEVAQRVAEMYGIPWPDELLRRQISPMVREFRRRQLQTVQPFYNAGVNALQSDDMQRLLRRLAQDLDERARDVERGASSENTVPPYNKKFSGRIDQLLELRRRLQDDRAGVISGIHGLGGIGKTELAYTYAHAFAGVYPGGRFYVPCEGKDSLKEALLHLGEVFHDQITDKEREEPSSYFAAIKRCLRRRLDEVGHILLILDNVTTTDVVLPSQTDELTSLGPKLHLLFTTRLPPAGTGQWLTLGELSPDEALELLEKHRPFENELERTSAQTIVSRLGGFALALELVAAGMASHPDASYADIATELGLDDLDTLAEDVNVELRRHNHEKRLRAVLGPALVSLTPAERRAVEFSALLPSDQVPLSWLQSLVKAGFPETDQQSKWGSPWEKLCQRLVRLALFTRVEEEVTSQRLVRVHRLVQEVVRSDWPLEVSAKLQQQVDDLVASRVAAIDKLSSWSDSLRELGVLESLALLWDARSHPKAAWLLRTVGEQLHRHDEWTRAESLLRKAITRLEEQSQDTSTTELQLNLARAQVTLAQVSVSIGSFQESRQLMDQALSSLRTLASLDPDHRGIRMELARSLVSDGTHYWRNHEYSAALAKGQEASRILEDLWLATPGDPECAFEMANCCNLLGNANRSLSHESDHHFIRGQEILGSTLERQTNRVASLHLLSSFSHNLSLTGPASDESLALLRKALQGVDEALVLAPGAPSLLSVKAQTLGGLARRHAQLKQHERARQCHQDSISLARLVSLQNPRANRFQWLLTESLIGYAMFLTSQREYESAEQLYIEARDLLERLIGEATDRPSYVEALLQCHASIAHFRKGAGGVQKLRSDEARLAYAQTLRDTLALARRYGEVFPKHQGVQYELFRALHLLGVAEGENGNDEATLALQEESIKCFQDRVAQEALSPTDPKLNLFLEACSRFQDILKQHELLEKIIGIAETANAVAGHCQSRYGIQYLTKVQTGQARALIANGKGDAAAEVLQRAIDAAKSALEEAPWHWWLRQQLAGMYYSLAEINRNRGSAADEIAAWHGHLQVWLGPYQGMPIQQFLSDDRPNDLEEAKRLREFVASAPTLRRFRVPCDFSGLSVDFEVYITESPPEMDPLADQARWLEEELGGKIPEKVRESFRKLRALAEKHNVSFADLCAYALEVKVDSGGEESKSES